MIKTNNKPLIIAIFAIIAITSIFSIFIFWDQRTIFSCDFHFNMDTPDKQINMNINFYLFDDGTGFQSDYGTVVVNEKKYTVDRDIMFTYKNIDKYTYEIKFAKLAKRSADNIPNEIKLDSASYVERYYSFSKLQGDITLIKEGGRPSAMCIKR